MISERLLRYCILLTDKELPLLYIAPLSLRTLRTAWSAVDRYFTTRSGTDKTQPGASQASQMQFVKVSECDSVGGTGFKTNIKHAQHAMSFGRCNMSDDLCWNKSWRTLWL